MPASAARSLSSPPPEDGDFRARLVAGMAQAIRDRGSFHETTVAEVVRNARTSRRTFYEHFADREACFLALAEELSARHLAVLTEAAAVDAPWPDRVDRALGAWLAALAADPALSRSCIQEVASLGPAAAARSQEVDRQWALTIVQLVEGAREQDPSLRPMSLEVATVITGGFRALVAAALNRGEDVTRLLPTGADLVRRLAQR